MSLGEGKAYNVITGDAVGLAPGAHDVGIVVGQDGDDIDTLGAELGELLDVLGDVVGRADGGEGTCSEERVAVSKRDHWWKSVRKHAEIGRSGDEPGRAKRMTFLSAHSLEAK